MKFNVAVLAVLATTLAGAPLIATAADSGGNTPTASTTHKAKHTHHKSNKKSKKGSSSSPDNTAPK